MKRFILCFFVLLFMSTSVQAEPIKIKEIVSKSGIKAWLVEDEKLPLVAMRMIWRGGVEQDEPQKQGLAILTASLMNEGAGPYNKQAFQQILADESLSLSFSASRDQMNGSLKMLKSSSKIGFKLLREALLHPHFAAADVDLAKNQQLASIKASMARPDWQARYALFSAIYGQHPYGERSLGSVSTLASLTRDDVQAAAKAHFARDNMVVAIVGSMKPDEVAAMLDDVFSGLPAKAQLRPIANVETLARVGGTQLQAEREGTQTTMFFAQAGLKRDDPDYYVAEIANYILGGGGFSSRLMKAVREKAGLTYGISTSLAPMNYGGLLVGSVSTENTKAASVLSLLNDVCAEFAALGPQDAEVERAKSYLKGALPLTLTSTSSIAAMLAEMQADNLGIDYLEKRKQLIDKVRVEDVRRVAKQWFDPSHFVFSFVGKPEGLGTTEPFLLVRE